MNTIKSNQSWSDIAQKALETNGVIYRITKFRKKENGAWYETNENGEYIFVDYTAWTKVKMFLKRYAGHF